MSLEVVTIDEERGLWDRALAAMPPPLRDVYFESSYSLVWQRHGDGRAMGAIWEEPGARVLYPFLLRELGDRPGVPADLPCRDITTPYGYGGPIADTPPGDDRALTRFREAFDRWCRDERVVSEFIRFHPLLANERAWAPHLEVVPLGETVWCEVGPEAGPFSDQMDSSHRRNLRKAQRSGLVASVETGDDAYADFLALYTATMGRRGAAESYFFDRKYFDDFRELLGERQALIAVRSEGEVVAGGVLMRSERFAHYHLGGSSAAHLHLRPNNLFFFEAMEWARRLGVERLHLGGGYRPDDELLRFKQGLGKGRGRFAIGRRIHLPDLYERLAAQHVERHGAVATSYFPAYRAPALQASGT